MMASRADITRRRSTAFTVTNTVSCLQKTADDIILKMQQALGRAPTSKGQYVTINHGERFHKKHVRLLSVFLFLMCVSSGAIYGGIYYTYYWKPCTRKLLYKETSDTCTCATDVHEMWAEEKYQNKWTETKKCAEFITEPTCRHKN